MSSVSAASRKTEHLHCAALACQAGALLGTRPAGRRGALPSHAAQQCRVAGHLSDAARQRHKAFDELIRQHGIAAKSAHMLEGAPENRLPRFVHKRQIFLIGHTAERLLEAVDCDLLVIKPATEK